MKILDIGCGLESTYYKEEGAVVVHADKQSSLGTVQADINKKLPQVLGDKSKLKRVLTNLIGNAIKFAKEKDEIRIRVLKEGTFVRIEIIDHGLGLDPGNLEKIFEKFFQVDSSPTRNTQGIGMGLAIARDLIELHNGKIWAESKGLKQGTAIILLLPTINENIY